MNPFLEILDPALSYKQHAFSNQQMINNLISIYHSNNIKFLLNEYCFLGRLKRL